MINLKPYLLAVGALALNFLSTMTPAYASDDPWVDDFTGLPMGNYGSSCTNIQWSESTKVLTATCVDDVGIHRTSSVTIPVALTPSVYNTILNCGGYLQVVETGRCDPSPGTIPPVGTYMSHCNNVKWDDAKKVLSASCLVDPAKNNFWASALNVPSIYMDIASCNGVLTILRSKAPTCPVANTTPTTSP